MLFPFYPTAIFFDQGVSVEDDSLQGGQRRGREDAQPHQVNYDRGPALEDTYLILVLPCVTSLLELRIRHLLITVFQFKEGFNKQLIKRFCLHRDVNPGPSELDHMAAFSVNQFAEFTKNIPVLQIHIRCHIFLRTVKMHQGYFIFEIEETFYTLLFQQ